MSEDQDDVIDRHAARHLGRAPVNLVVAQLHAQVVEGVEPRGLEDREARVVVERMVVGR